MYIYIYIYIHNTLIKIKIIKLHSTVPYVTFSKSGSGNKKYKKCSKKKTIKNLYTNAPKQ